MKNRVTVTSEGYKVPKLFCPCEVYTCHQPYGHWFESPRKKDAKKLVKALIEVALIITIIVAIIMGLSSIGVAHAEGETIGFPTFWDHDSRLVTNVQERLVFHELLKEEEVDGKFGPKTSRAVKQFQLKNGLTVNGVVDDNVALALGLTTVDWPYNEGWTLYYMANLQTIYNKSDYEDLIYISLGGRGYDPNNAEMTGSHLWLFRDGVLIADSPCITGNESKGYLTPLGTRHIKGRHEEDSGKYSTYRWLIHLNEKYFIHGMLEYFDSNRDHQVLGAHQSDGSIRVPTAFAEWLYKNEPNGVTVVIDDRAYNPYNAPGWEHLIEEDGEYAEYADWEEDYSDEDEWGEAQG